MIKCSSCKAEIEKDSFYCDQCGELLYFCPKCLIPGKGKGKRCGQCGTVLVEATSLASGSGQAPVAAPSAPVASPVHAAAPVHAAPSPAPSAPVAPSATEMPVEQMRPAPIQEPRLLVCRTENVTIVLKDNAVIGRVNGDYLSVTSRLIYLSGTHAKIYRSNNEWYIRDLGSRNGTKVNGVSCTPELKFRKGDVVRIANFYDFSVE